jgi:hypothetical protein
MGREIMPVPPWRLNEVLERSERGPICMERDFDTKILFPNLKRVIKEHDIKFDPEVIIPSDGSLADDVWEAALDLYLTVGTLCINTHRRILFTEREIKEAMNAFPGEITVGFGKDARKMSHRKVEDRKRPFCLFSPDITYDEELFVPVAMAYLQEPLADGVCGPLLDEIEGTDIKANAPSDIRGSVAHALMFREAARRVGRPGIFLQGVGTAEADTAQIAVSNPEWGERLTDGRFVPTITELKIDYSALNRMVHFHEYGCFVGCLFGPLFGGYCGGAEGTAVVGVASHIQALMVAQAHYSNYFPMHLMHSFNTSRELLWAISVTYQTLAKHTPFISTSNGFAAAGPCTPMVLYEAAAHGLTSSVSGGNLWEMAVARNKHKNRATPMEARMACEVGCAAADVGLKREDANELVKEIVKKYEANLTSAPLGKNFQECYDVKKVRPREEYVQLFEEIKKELIQLGVPFLF